MQLIMKLLKEIFAMLGARSFDLIVFGDVEEQAATGGAVSVPATWTITPAQTPTVTSGVSWITFASGAAETLKTDSALNFTLAETTEVKQREGFVTFEYYGAKKIVSVKQAAGVPVLTASTDAVAFDAAGGTSSVTLTKNACVGKVTATSDAADWLTATSAGAITATANETGEARTGTITFAGANGGEAVVTATQAALGQ